MNPGSEPQNQVMDHLKDAFGERAEDMSTLTTEGTHTAPIYVHANPTLHYHQHPARRTRHS